MNKKKLLAMSALRATKKILELAALDELKTRKLLLHGFPYQGKGYQWGRYLRSKVQDGILHVAIFLPEPLCRIWSCRRRKYPLCVRKDWKLSAI